MRKVGLVLGLLFFGGFVGWSFFPSYIPEGLSSDMLKVLAVTLLMACFWVTEVIPIPATSLMPLALLPFLGVLPTKEIAPAYGDRMILLLMGGFFLATVVEKVHLHKRIALNVIYRVGTSPRRVLLGFMVATAFLSMWISNTATTLMLLPIVLAVVSEIEKQEQVEGLAVAFCLAVAYSASVGGTGTPIGTPPNLIMLAQYNNTRLNQPELQLNEITFADWMLVCIPMVVVFIFAMWVYLAFIKMSLPAGKRDSKELIESELRALGKISYEEKVTLILFAITAFLWVFRSDINLGVIFIPGWSPLLGIEKQVDDASVAILMAIVMFSYPLKEGKKLLDWETAVKIPWGMLLLFGGGIALAVAFKETQLSHWLGGVLEQNLSQFTPYLMMLVVCLFMTFLTEITSNTAVTTVMMPILAITAISIQVHPAFLMMPAAISASYAFMLPVATAPNAIMYGTQKFSIAQMSQVGFWLNLLGALTISGFYFFVGEWIISGL